MHYYRRIIVADNISLECKYKVNALNSKIELYTVATHIRIFAPDIGR